MEAAEGSVTVSDTSERTCVNEQNETNQNLQVDFKVDFSGILK